MSSYSYKRKIKTSIDTVSENFLPTANLYFSSYEANPLKQCVRRFAFFSCCCKFEIYQGDLLKRYMNHFKVFIFLSNDLNNLQTTLRTTKSN